MAASPLHVLTLTPFYPTASDDAQGCFIAEPLPWLTQLGVCNSVIAVEPFYRAHSLKDPHSPDARRVRFLSLPGGPGQPTAGIFLFVSLLRTVRRLHLQRPISVIHAHAALPCGHAAALLSRELKIPFTVTVHGLDAYSTRQIAGRTGAWCKNVSKFVYTSAARVICISEKVRARVLEAAPGKVSTEVVYNGVDEEKFRPSIGDSEAPTILCVGNLILIKGQEILLKTLAKIRPKFPDISCVLIGDGPERGPLNELAKDLNLAVVFRGRVSRSEVAAAMGACTVFALPSSYEGLGCVYLEAMASGKPPIGCKGQGIDEVIEHGENGWLVSPGSGDELANVLSEVLLNAQLRKEVGKRSRETILRSFTLQYQAARLAEIYAECAG